MKEKIKYLFTPNAIVSKETFMKIFVVELIVLLITWHLNQSAHLPGPIAVAEAIPGLIANDNFVFNLLTSFFLSLGAMTLSVFVGMFLSYSSQLPIGGPIAMLSTKFRFSAFSGFVFIFLLIFPSGFMFKVFSLMFALVPWIVTGSVSEFTDIEKTRFNHLRTLGFSEWKIMRELIIYGKLPKVLEIIRQNYAMLWMMIATVESMYISEGGIGALLEMKRKYLANLPTMLAIQLIVFVFAIFMDGVLKSVFRAITPWGNLKNEKK